MADNIDRFKKMVGSTEAEVNDTSNEDAAPQEENVGSESKNDVQEQATMGDVDEKDIEEDGNVAEGGEDGKKNTDDTAPVTKAAPQAGGVTDLKPHDSLDDMEDCKLSPLDAQAQRQSMRDALDGKEFSAPLTNDAINAVKSVVNTEKGNHVHFSENFENNESSLHADDYVNSENTTHNPNDHESALHSDPPGGKGTANHMLDKIHRKFPRITPGQGKKSHSHPRKSPFRSKIAKLREQQRLEKEKTGSTSKNVGIAATTAPPDSASFAKQAEKVKHKIIQTLGEFLTGAFADDEELSGSYFSQDLLDQISADDPAVKGIWLQAKNLNDNHVKQLCEGLIRNKNVTEVWLPANQITDVGAGHIAHMLKFNHSIKELFLGKNEIGPKVRFFS